MLADLLWNIRSIRYYMLIDTDIGLLYAFLFPVVTGICFSFVKDMNKYAAGLLSITPLLARMAMFAAGFNTNTYGRKIFTQNGNDQIYFISRDITILILMFLLGMFVCSLLQKKEIKKTLPAAGLILALCLSLSTACYAKNTTPVNPVRAEIISNESGKDFKELSLKKICPEFAVFDLLRTENNILYFIGNTKDLKRTCRMADINDWRNLSLCRLDMKTGKIIKRKFPAVTLNRKFDVLCEDTIIIGGERQIMSFDKKDLSIVRKEAVSPHCRLQPLKINSDGLEKTYLLTTENITNSECRFKIRDWNSMSVTAEYSCSNMPVVAGNYVIFERGMKQNKSFFILDAWVLAKGAVPEARELFAGETVGYSGFHLCAEGIIFLEENKIHLLDPASGKIVWTWESKRKFTNLYIRKLCGNLLILEDCQDIMIFNIAGRSMSKSHGESGYAYRAYYDPTGKNTIIPFDTNTYGCYRFVVLDENGNKKSEFIRKNVWGILMENRCLYLLMESGMKIRRESVWFN
jgi:hypothetical protein